ncbi:sugar ABC transporter substrate-binding protein [Paenibacillus swuensis]|uniref:Sugar ABC transporter substrate-binding protein n=1 Tax=Paenibacillus swuensis TaxID=1178515 RepID=A0A172TGH5_9BACL|nr:ABC transporter substrate-binding protein [Paenibacillus swuensis]ANE46155.1 sugar ABC transporter substrate-binding protein [Paenibacillus swuensis]
MKQRMNVLLGAVLSVSLMLTACGGNNANNVNGTGTETKEPSSETTKEEGKTDDLKPYTISFIYPGTEQPDEKAVEAKMNEILTEKINAKVDLQAIDWGAWNDKMNLMFATGEPADVVFTASWNGHSQNVKKGAFLELDGLLEKYGQDIIKTENPDFLKGAAINGKLYAIPTNKEIAASRGVIVRKDLAEKYKMDFTSVKTLTDLEPFLKTIKDNEPGVTPLFQSSTQTIPTYITEWDSLGDASIPGAIRSANTETKIVNRLEDPSYLDTLKLMRSWYTKGYINKDAATSKLLANETAKTGKVFMWPESLKPGKDKEMEGSVGFPLTQIEITPPYITTGDTTNSMLGISKTSGNPERAMMLINLLHVDKELLNLLDWGIEGTHYVKVSDNVIKLPEGADPANRPYNHGSAWMFGDQFLSFLWDNEDPAKWDNFRKFNDSAKASPGLGFTFDPEPVKSEMAVLTNIGAEFTASLETGAVDPEEVLPKYISKQKAAGLEKVIAEKQKQFDAFLGTK